MSDTNTYIYVGIVYKALISPRYFVQGMAENTGSSY